MSMVRLVTPRGCGNLISMNRALVDEYAAFAEEEYTAGSISKATYYKVCATLASEYLKDFGDVEACLTSLAKVEPEYFLGDCVLQMEADSLFAGIMIEFTYHLNRWGVLHQSLFKPTQSQANA